VAEKTVPVTGAEAAHITLQKAMLDPLELASSNATMRDAVKGAYGILHALVRRDHGVSKRVLIPRNEWQIMPPGEQLLITTDADGNAYLYIRAKGEK
jgi:hypothetical protein